MALYLDCDTGVDDALAIAYLIAEGVVPDGIGTVSGNVSAEQAATNTLGLLALAGRPEVPVAVGAHDFLSGPFTAGPAHVHGADGVGGVALPAGGSAADETAVDMLLRLAHEHPGALDVLAIGPFTNLALALAADPDLPELVRSVTVMGGAALAPGNVTAVAEANVWHDRTAAAQVFDAAWPVTMVGLDATMTARFDEQHREALLAGPPVAAALGAMLEVYFEYYTSVLGVPSSALHDPLAAAIAIGRVVPDLAPVVPVEVDATDGPGAGQTLVDLRGRYGGYPPLEGTRHRVVLTVPDGFPDALAAALLTL